MKQTAIIIGSGMGSLTTACLLAKQGLAVKVIEQNYLPGGCTSAYWRKGFVFEAGATTLVGLSPQMPLQYLLQQTGIHIEAWKLALPMRVHLKDGQILHRYQDLEAWIAEAERVFGKAGQRPFWEFCYKISQFVWQTSLKQLTFPPKKIADLWNCFKNTTAQQIRLARFAFMSTQKLLQHFGLHTNPAFVEFVNEQLLITAQNYAPEVNVLFGATALCYTNYDNYYVPGGLINLVQPLITYLQQQGSELLLRESVMQITQQANKQYAVVTNKQTYIADFIISGIPLNNTLKIYPQIAQTALKRKVLPSKYLNSAFQMGIAFKLNPNATLPPAECIHLQLHLPKPLAQVGSHSIFVSLSHPQDHSRSDLPNHRVASVSTHIASPAETEIIDKTETEKHIIEVLAQNQILQREDIVYKHSSTQKSWEKWTGRQYGFVGGYPQMFRIKPWQMVESRLDNYKAYLCGDTTYPGQGIPGTVLSGIIAFEKLKRDWLQ